MNFNPDTLKDEKDTPTPPTAPLSSSEIIFRDVYREIFNTPYLFTDDRDREAARTIGNAISIFLRDSGTTATWEDTMRHFLRRVAQIDDGWVKRNSYTPRHIASNINRYIEKAKKNGNTTDRHNAAGVSEDFMRHIAEQLGGVQ
jgi:hypothetical protein